MARKRLTAADERQAIADAIAARDDDTEPERANLKPAEAGTIVLSVRLPLDQARALRELAAERRQSLSALLVDAVQTALSMGGPRVSVGERTSRLFVSGVAFDFGQTGLGKTVVFYSGPEPALATA